MVERVARGVCPELDTLPDGSDHAGQKGWWFTLAGEAIRAMREPTEAMIQARQAVLGYDGDNTAKGYRAMIDAALTPSA